jgi:hypothetical protein
MSSNLISEWRATSEQQQRARRITTIGFLSHLLDNSAIDRHSTLHDKVPFLFTPDRSL